MICASVVGFVLTVDIKQEHTVIIMLAVGLPREEIKVCASERRPLTEVYTRLEE